MDYHPLSAIHDCLFNIFAATFHTGDCSSIRNRRTRYAVVTGNLRERDHLGDQGIVGRIIFKWNFRKWDVGDMDLSVLLRIGTGGGHL